MTEPLTGGCLCGAVRYSIAAEPMFPGHCACDNCRKGSGGEHASLYAVPAAAVSATGKTRSFSHPADSGATVTRHFCPACGSLAWSENSRMADLRFFPAGGLDDLARFTPGLFVYHARKAPWDRAAEGLTTFAGMPPMGG